jgi:hypothetical protein
MTTVTAKMTTEQIVALMIEAGAPTIVGQTYITDLVAEGDPVEMSISELVAEWIECEEQE